MSRCENCDRPVATDADFESIPPGEGEHLCWSAYGAQCEPEDWRAMALKAETERDEARAEVERLRASVENLDALYVSRTDALRECEAALRTVAERQREACAVEARFYVGLGWTGEHVAQQVRATPLVTEGEP